MTKTQFMALCEKYLVDPNIALENDNLRVALRQHNDKKAEEILQQEFYFIWEKLF